jgi:flagellar L-ring protein precursor FlgH
MNRIIKVLLLVCTALLTRAVRADSIWDRRDPRAAYLFVDNRARRVGDNVTVLVQEATNITQNDQLQMNKTSQASGTFTFKRSTAGNGTAKAGTVDFEPAGSANRTFNGQSQYSVDRTFVESVGVVVTDVLPNGNLVVEGNKRVVVSGEERIIRISGIVRPIDISLTNTVSSTTLANFAISYTGKGPQSRFTNQNYLSKILNYVWPF